MVGSKTETGTRYSLISDDLNIFMSLRLPNICTVFQVTIYTDIHIDSLISFKAQVWNVVELKCLYDYIQSLKMFNHHQVKLIEHRRQRKNR